MKDGYIKVAAVSPKITVANPLENSKQIIENIIKASRQGAKIIVLPELCIPGYTCSDLFFQHILINKCNDALYEIAKKTENIDALIFVGHYISQADKLYNVAAVLNKGRVLAFIPKKHIPTYNEFYEGRYFEEAPHDVEYIDTCLFGTVPFGTNIIFKLKEMKEVKVAAEICEDLWVPNPPSIMHAMAGANIIVNLSASDEAVGKADYRRDLIKSQSGSLVCGYVYASAGLGESTQDVVYSAHNIIAENGGILAEASRFDNEMLISEIDVYKLLDLRRKMTTFKSKTDGYLYLDFEVEISKTDITRKILKKPFVPSDKTKRDARCKEILNIQAYGLKQRLEHIGSKSVVIGISGGLDSTLALLVCARAFEIMGKDKKFIKAVTMPGFGTSDRTYDNAVNLIKAIGASFEEVDIKASVRQHFADIGHDENNHDVTYENSQARERTQILMDISNRDEGIVIGTGDLSELALGWATYNGDHMSMYGVNASVPKTLIRYLVAYYADSINDDNIKSILYDILDTPVSPELLPLEDGNIVQKTEELVGPYELHDFFLYNMLRFSYSPAKIYRLAKIAFNDEYENEVILKWLRVFCRRFFSQQFKRSALPDGPKVGTIALSPRGDLRMPSDASAKIWLNEIDTLR